jgi:hypothetical protein
VSEVSRVAQQRLKIAHYGNYGVSLTVSLLSIFDSH